MGKRRFSSFLVLRCGGFRHVGRVFLAEGSAGEWLFFYSLTSLLHLSSCWWNQAFVSLNINLCSVGLQASQNSTQIEIILSFILPPAQPSACTPESAWYDIWTVAGRGTCTKYGLCDICPKNCQNDNQQCVRSDKPGKFTCKIPCDLDCQPKGICTLEKAKKVCKCRNGLPNFPACEKGCEECKDDLGLTNTTQCIKSTLSFICDCKNKQFTYPRLGLRHLATFALACSIYVLVHCTLYIQCTVPRYVTTSDSNRRRY